jgi:hypothetical protein
MIHQSSWSTNPYRIDTTKIDSFEDLRRLIEDIKVQIDIPANSKNIEYYILKGMIKPNNRKYIDVGNK